MRLDGLDAYERLGVRRVINASGRMTALGGAAVRPEVARAMAEAAGSFVDVAELKAAASRRIAELTGAEGAYLTTGAAAGIAVMTAAAVAGTDPARVAALPDADWEPCEIVLQAGHLIDFGAPLRQMVRLGGGRPVAVGSVNQVRAAELAAAIGPRTAAVLFVQSHHAVQKGMLGLDEVTAIARAAGVPVLVDAAAEEDLSAYLVADLVAFSGGKAPEGPTSGFVLGRRGLIAGCWAQERGIARPMKIGKEAVVGLLAALEAYVARDAATESGHRRAVVDGLLAELRGIDGIVLGVETDEAGRDIPRVTLGVAPGAGFSLAELVRELQAGSPAIHARTHHLREGRVALDPRPLLPGEPAIVGAGVRAAVRRLTSR